MGAKYKHAWLAEVVEDMIVYCADNNLFQSRESLREAHRMIVSETILEHYQEMSSGRRPKDSSSSDGS